MKNFCKIILPVLLLLWAGAVMPAQAQQAGAGLGNVTGADTVADASTSAHERLVDSIKMAEMERALEEARLKEITLRMEMEELRFATIVADSIKKAQMRQRIDSLRQVTPGVPVVVEGDTLYQLYTNRGGLSPQARAESVSAAVLALGKSYTLRADSLRVESTEITTDIMYGNTVVASFTDQDALWANTTRDELADARKDVLLLQLIKLQKEYGLLQLIKRILLFVLVLAVQVALIWGTNRLYHRLRRRIKRMSKSRMKAVSFHNYEILDTKKQVVIMLFFFNLLRYVVILVQLMVFIPILFSIFPQTESLAYRIFSYVWSPIKRIGGSILDYIPNLFTIIVIWLTIRYLVRGVKYLADEIENEKLKISGFYPDWAQSTYHIVRFLLYAFMIAMIYPYLPGAESGVFQGVSVFVGLIISLGSSSVIGNIMAGMVITYMRPFKIGDRIKLNETVGNVTEKTPFVTRLKTPKNEVVTIPNSFVLSSHTVNYSASARDYGLIIHTEVSFGYEVHWKTVHDILINAALQTAGIMETPRPFVLETSLNDFYVMYQINAYINDANKLSQIYSDLNQHIHELTNQAGIELLSPHYYAGRDGSASTIRKPEGE